MFLLKHNLFCNATTEIRRVSGFNQTLVDHERLEHESPFRTLSQNANGRPMDLEGWPGMQMEVMLVLDIVDVYFVICFTLFLTIFVVS